MYLKAVLIILTCALRSCNHEIIEQKLPHELPQGQYTATRCGSVLTVGAEIVYKPHEDILNNERCVWVIAIQNAIGYVVNIVLLGTRTNKPGSGQELVLTGIGKNWVLSDFPLPELTSVKPAGLRKIDFSHANVLLVTFTSSFVKGRSHGFALEYNAILATRNIISAKSTHHLFVSEQLEFKYPVEGTKYENFELAVFVFLPKNNIYTGNRGVVGWKYISYESNCKSYDTLRFFKFKPNVSSSVEKWELQNGFCENSGYSLVHDDIMLAIFTSDHAGVNEGFEFIYEIGPFT